MLIFKILGWYFNLVYGKCYVYLFYFVVSLANVYILRTLNQWLLKTFPTCKVITIFVMLSYANNHSCPPSGAMWEEIHKSIKPRNGSLEPSNRLVTIHWNQNNPQGHKITLIVNDVCSALFELEVAATYSCIYYLHVSEIFHQPG